MKERGMLLQVLLLMALVLSLVAPASMVGASGAVPQPDDRPAFEMCLNNPKDHHEHKHIVEIYVPVKPL